MTKKKVAAPVALKSYKVAHAMENIAKKQEAEQARFDALSDEEKVEYLKKQEENRKKIDEFFMRLSKYSRYKYSRFSVVSVKSGA